MTPLTGTVDMSRKKADLITIAKGIKIPGHDAMQFSKVNKETLIKLIKEHMATHANTLSTDPVAQGLYVYGGSTGRAGAVGKNSADKAREDAIEDAKPQDEPTAAHKKLLDAKRTTDPPGQRRLYQSSVTQANKAAVPHESPPQQTSPVGSPLSTRPSSPHDPKDVSWPVGFRSPIAEGPAHVDAAELDLPQLPDNDELPAIPFPSTPKKQKYNIRVTFKDYDGREEAQEVWVEAGSEVPVDRKSSPSGGHNDYYARLSDMVPAALEQDTPIRKTGGRIWRAGVTGESGKTNIGTIQSLLEERTTKPLRLPLVNSYKLAQLDDGLLGCEVFWQKDNMAAAAPITETKPAATGSVTPTKRMAKEKMPVKSMDSVSAEKSALAVSKEQIVDYMRREVFRGLRSDWPRAEIASTCLQRYNTVQEALELLKTEEDARQPPHGGWTLPDDHHTLPGAHFDKAAVLEALNIKKGTASADATLFLIESSGQQKLENWIKNPDDKSLKDKFGQMSISQLRSWKERHLPKKKASASSADTKGKGKPTAKSGGKRDRAHFVSDDSEEEHGHTSDDSVKIIPNPKKKAGRKAHREAVQEGSSRKKSKYTHEYDSDELDE